MGAAGCFTCKVQKTEDDTTNNFYDRIMLKYIYFREFYRKLNKSKFNIAGNEIVNYNDFKDSMIKFLPDDLRE